MYYIIVNPASKSGMGQQKWLELEQTLKSSLMTYQVFFTKKTADAMHFAEKITQNNKASQINLIVLGGDGTVNEVLNGISDFKKTVITYLPTGSSNDLARDLHISSDVSVALNRARQLAKPRAMDYGTVQYKNGSRRFAVSCGIGYDAAICEEAFRTKMKSILNKIGLGKLVYVYLGIKQITKPSAITCELYLDDAPPLYFDHLLFSTFMIHRYEGGGVNFCPNADYHDGILDICLINNIKGLKGLRLLPLAMLGKHEYAKEVHSYQAKKVRIKTSSPLFVHTDGEIVGKLQELTLTCEKNKLHYS